MPGSLAWAEARFYLLGRERECVCLAMLAIGEPVHVTVRFQGSGPRGLATQRASSIGC